jgi:hypothetical protein
MSIIPEEGDRGRSIMNSRPAQAKVARSYLKKQK